MKEYDDGYEITKDDMVKQIAEDTYTSQATVRSILDSMEQRIYDCLCFANEEKPYVKIKIFEGFVIESNFVPATKRRNNIDGKMIKIKNKIRAKAKFNRYYQKALSDTLD